MIFAKRRVIVPKLHIMTLSPTIFQVGIASKTLGGGGNQMLPLPEKALSESMEKGGRKMQGKDTQKWKIWNI